MTSKYQSYIDAWKARARRERQERQEREHAARAKAEKLARILAQEYQVRKVVLFGSLARSGEYDARSDIDLAVEGLPAHAHLEAIERLERESGLRVDLVDLADANDRVLRAVEREGSPLYEASPH